MHKEKSCGAVISRTCNGELEVLLIQHTNGGHWAFPKGHVENGETEEETAAREILEETGLNAKLDLNFREMVTYSPKKGTLKDVVYFCATADDAAPVARPGEIDKVCWVSPEEAMSRINFENDRNILKKFLNYIS